MADMGTTKFTRGGGLLALHWRIFSREGEIFSLVNYNYLEVKYLRGTVFTPTTDCMCVYMLNQQKTANLILSKTLYTVYELKLEDDLIM